MRRRRGRKREWPCASCPRRIPTPRLWRFIRGNLGESSRMMALKNALYVEVFGDTMGQRLFRLNTAE